MVRRFLARFPGQVGLVHSKLSEGERYDTWRRARLGQLKVIIGPRSALFTPLPNPGLVAVDECHDGSYYQADPPFYNAVSAARTYARICGAVCILGSATPSIVQRYQAVSPPSAQGDESVLLELPIRIANPHLPSRPGGGHRARSSCLATVASSARSWWMPLTMCSKKTSRRSCFLTGAAQPHMSFAGTAGRQFAARAVILL